MNHLTIWVRGSLLALAAMAVTACSSYPDSPRYSTRPTGAAPAQSGPAYYPGSGPVAPPTETYVPPPATAPIESIEGGALPPPVSVGPARPAEGTPPASVPPASSGPTLGGSMAYVIQPGDTISGVGRRFGTPVRALIDLNGLGPQAAIRPGQSILLPASAVDQGNDPYATGPAPAGIVVSNRGTPPPPPPPVVRPAPPAAVTRPAPTPAPAPTPPVSAPPASTGTSLALQWPVRGDIVRRFGPVAMGERNNGINIGASAGAVVNASAAGRVAYVGDELPGQGLTVVIVHRDGWRTVYGHLGSTTVADNDDVRAGQQIGTVGLTAGDGRPSIHFETRRMQGDEPVAIDPLSVLPR